MFFRSEKSGRDGRQRNSAVPYNDSGAVCDVTGSCWYGLRDYRRRDYVQAMGSKASRDRRQEHVTGG